MYREDTIAAVATPPGVGGIGIVRVSGPASGAIADAVFQHRRGEEWDSHRLYHGHVLGKDGVPIDEALCVFMRAPRSYTGEDVLELHCHGSPAILRLVLASVFQAGARPALPGEFTKRAFLNGRLDLTQAEAVLGLIQARTPESAQLAATHLFGQLGGRLTEMKQRLIRACGVLEVQIDFSEEDVDLDDAAVMHELSEVATDVERLLRSYERGRILRDGLRVAIVGPPNAGKSSLLNALLGENRAIVTSVPGTTRDVIEEAADFGGVPVILSDTAGLRETPDEVERIGVERAQEAARSADLTLLVVDRSRPPEPVTAFHSNGPVVVVVNKIDLPSAWRGADLAAVAGGRAMVEVSATERIGLEQLRATVLATSSAAPADQLPTLTTARQFDALRKAHESLLTAMDAVRTKLPPELVAVDVQAALDHIGTVTGVATSEDVLDAIFAEFCIGK